MKSYDKGGLFKPNVKALFIANSHYQPFPEIDPSLNFHPIDCAHDDLVKFKKAFNESLFFDFDKYPQ